MSASMDSLPTHGASATAASALRVMWGRLLWKGAREVVPIWLTLLLSALLCLSVTAWMVNKDFAHIAPLYISGHTFIALISVITGVFLFASEDENRTLHLLRNLPLPPKQIVWQKVILGGAGVVALACAIAGITLLLACVVQSDALESSSSYRFTVANVILLPLLYLVISSVCSMVTRSHFYGVLIAGVVCTGVIAVLEPTWLGAREIGHSQRGQMRWLWVALSTLVGTASLVFNAAHWVEEKVITGASLPISDAISNKPAAASLRPEVKNPFPILLWQSYRQSRVVLACWFGMTVVGWIVIKLFVQYVTRHDRLPSAEVALVTSLWTLPWMFATTTLFASSIFLNDKHRGNYLFFQQNRERSKWFWLSRVLPFCGVALLLVLLWNLLLFDVEFFPFIPNYDSYYFNIRENELYASMIAQVASQSALVPFLVMAGAIGIGQYFSMFVRNPVLAFVFTGIVSVVFSLMVAYVIFVNESVFVFLLPLIASMYLATWWRSKSWLATTPSVTDFLKPAVMPLIVAAITAAFFIHHRATEFGDVEIDPNNYAEHLIANFYSDSWTKLGWQSIQFGTEAQRKQAAKLYREAIDLAGMNQVGLESPISATWPKSKLAKFASAKEKSFAKILEAAEIPVCDPFFSSDPAQREEEGMALFKIALLSSHYHLLEGNLSRAKKGIDAYDRFWQRTSHYYDCPRMESGYYAMLVKWADHPEQKLAAVKSAIMQLEGNASDIGPIKMVNGRGKSIDVNSSFAFQIAVLFREFGGEQAFKKMQQEIADLQADNENHQLVEIRNGFRLIPWEYQRLTKVSQLRVLRQYEVAQRKIALEATRNNQAFGRDLNNNHTYPTNWQNDGPHIPIDEDRIGLGALYAGWNGWVMRQVATNVTWRRYALLRLGLAAYKIEHDSYPDELVQLASYYQNELPLTTDGMMFAWFKDGMGSDLIRATYESGDFDSLKSAEVLADGNKPLLLPFSLAPSKPLPDPIDYDHEKMGIEIDKLNEDHQAFVPRWGIFSYYPMDWSVGER